jgi:hypothetical protein
VRISRTDETNYISGVRRSQRNRVDFLSLSVNGAELLPDSPLQSGNANLQIGGLNDAIQENGVPARAPVC